MSSSEHWTVAPRGDSLFMLLTAGLVGGQND